MIQRLSESHTRGVGGTHTRTPNDLADVAAPPSSCSACTIRTRSTRWRAAEAPSGCTATSPGGTRSCSRNTCRASLECVAALRDRMRRASCASRLREQAFGALGELAGSATRRRSRRCSQPLLPRVTDGALDAPQPRRAIRARRHPPGRRAGELARARAATRATPLRTRATRRPRRAPRLLDAGCALTRVEPSLRARLRRAAAHGRRHRRLLARVCHAARRGCILAQDDGHHAGERRAPPRARAAPCGARRRKHRIVREAIAKRAQPRCVRSWATRRRRTAAATVAAPAAVAVRAAGRAGVQARGASGAARSGRRSRTAL